VVSGFYRSSAYAALALAGVLGGCANIDYEAGGWFSKPMDIVGRKGGYNYSELQDSRKQRVITANDFVDARGACPAPAAPPPPAAAPGGPAAAGPPAAALPPDSLLGNGIALGMSECDVVNRAGAPSSVEIGKNQQGERTAVLTFNAGPRPGIYRFVRGELLTIDRGAEPVAAPDAAKKKPAKTAKNNQT
jgi:hypothetical protein